MSQEGRGRTFPLRGQGLGQSWGFQGSLCSGSSFHFTKTLRSQRFVFPGEIFSSLFLPYPRGFTSQSVNHSTAEYFIPIPLTEGVLLNLNSIYKICTFIGSCPFPSFMGFGNKNCHCGEVGNYQYLNQWKQTGLDTISLHLSRRKGFHTSVLELCWQRKHKDVKNVPQDSREMGPFALPIQSGQEDHRIVIASSQILPHWLCWHPSTPHHCLRNAIRWISPLMLSQQNRWLQTRSEEWR